MPLSGPDWDLPLSEFVASQGHMVQGVKRKMTCDAEAQACSGQNVLIEYAAKRHCKDNDFVNSILPPMTMMAPALLQSSPTDQVHEEMEVHSVYGCMKYTAVSSQHRQEDDSQTHLDSKSQLLPLQNNLLMDLDKDIYSSKHDQDLDSIDSAMESDSVPDTQRQNIGYCCTPCPGGERSPNSNRVRCYCRPALDPMFDIGPYCSDYY